MTYAPYIHSIHNIALMRAHARDAISQLVLFVLQWEHMPGR